MNTSSIYFVSVLVCFSLAGPVKHHAKKQRNKDKFSPKIVSTCNALEICNETRTYPFKVIQRLVKRKKNLPLFSKVSLIEPADDVPIPKLRGPGMEPNNLCKTKTITVLPKAGYDHNSGEQRFIINIKDYVQSVVYETCAEPNQECIDPKMLPFGFRTLCRQKYNIVRLVSLSSDGKVDYGKFMVPSTCVCSYCNDNTNALLPF
ncbi:uncharacterized protein LOC109543982 [Dendroctonus ponderosae]